MSTNLQPITQKETFTFLEKVLHIFDPKKELNENKLAFINQMIVAWHKYLPYQNISQLILNKVSRRLLTAQEIVQEQLKGQGGICLYHNYFAYLVLLSLNFDAHLISCTVFDNFDHVITLVKNLIEDGDEYLIEVGCGYPALEAIPMHKLSSSNSAPLIYNQAGLEFLYLRKNQKIIRYHRAGDDPGRKIMDGDYLPGGWRRYHDFELRPRDAHEPFASVNGIYKCLTSVNAKYWFLTQVRAVVVSEGTVIAIKHDRLIIQNETGERKEIHLTDRQMVLEAFAKYFPMLNINHVETAIECVATNITEAETNN